MAMKPKKHSMLNMVLESLQALNDKKGSSVQAIKGWVLANYPETNTTKFKFVLRAALKKGLDTEVLRKPSNDKTTGMAGRYIFVPQKPKKKKEPKAKVPAKKKPKMESKETEGKTVKKKKETKNSNGTKTKEKVTKLPKPKKVKVDASKGKKNTKKGNEVPSTPKAKPPRKRVVSTPSGLSAAKAKTIIKNRKKTPVSKPTKKTTLKK